MNVKKGGIRRLFLRIRFRWRTNFAGRGLAPAASLRKLSSPPLHRGAENTHKPCRGDCRIARLCSGLPPNAKKQRAAKATLCFFGRNEVIRTPDLLVPNQAHYQAVLHPDADFFSALIIITQMHAFVNSFFAFPIYKNIVVWYNYLYYILCFYRRISMKCPNCGFAESKVIDSRPVGDNTSIRRRR